MTAKRRPSPSGDEDDIRVSYSKWNQSLRWSILAAALSASPFGQQILKNIGVQSPATEQSTAIQLQLNKIDEGFREVKSDMQSIKANNAIINAKVDRFEAVFTGFQIDFDKYRKTPVAPVPLLPP